MQDERTKNLAGRDRHTRLADLFFELGMLMKTPRTGYQFLGSGDVNVAEHSFRTAVIGWTLAGLAGADAAKTAVMCLFHDLHETRTGDFNYVNKMYNDSRDVEALSHAMSGTGFREEVVGLFEEMEGALSLEAKLAQDADQLELIASLKEEQDMGNRYAADWIEGAIGRLRTEEGRKMAETLAVTDHKDWWFKGPDRSWWAKKNGRTGK